MNKRLVVSLFAVFSLLGCPPAQSSTDAGGTGGGGGAGQVLDSGAVQTMPDLAVTVRDVPVRAAVLENDAAGLTLSQVSGALNGTTRIVGRTIEYSPRADFVGTETLTYTATAGTAQGAGTLTVRVLDVAGVVIRGRLYSAASQPEGCCNAVNDHGDLLLDTASGLAVQFADGGTRLVALPDAGSAIETVLGRGLNNAGEVAAQFADPSTYQFVSFIERDGVVVRQQRRSVEGDFGVEHLRDDGVGAATDYDYVRYRAATWAPDGAVQLYEAPDGGSSYAKALSNQGILYGTIDTSASGYDGPQSGFWLDTTRSGSDFNVVRAPGHITTFTGANEDGTVVGYVKTRADREGEPRSVTDRVYSFLWTADAGMTRVPVPVDPPPDGGWRVEVALDVNASGTIVGYYINTRIVSLPDGGTRTSYPSRGFVLTPLADEPNTFFDDSTIDFVQPAAP